jgi:hypothetical protein
MFKNNRYLDEHNKRYHKPSKYFEVRESAFQKASVCYRYIIAQMVMNDDSDI